MHSYYNHVWKLPVLLNISAGSVALPYEKHLLRCITNHSGLFGSGFKSPTYFVLTGDLARGLQPKS